MGYGAMTGAPQPALDGNCRNQFDAAQAKELGHWVQDGGVGELNGVEQRTGKEPASPAMLEKIDLAYAPAFVDNPVAIGQGIDFDEFIAASAAVGCGGKQARDLRKIERMDLALNFQSLGRMTFRRERGEEEPDRLVQFATGIDQRDGRAVDREVGFYRPIQNSVSDRVRMPLPHIGRMENPAATEAIANCRLPIADWKREAGRGLGFQSAIGNRRSAIRSGLQIAFADQGEPLFDEQLFGENGVFNVKRSAGP